MKKRFLFILIFFNCFIVNAVNLDSLYNLLQQDVHDTVRIKALTEIGEAIYMGHQDSALTIWTQGLIECESYLEKYPKDTFGLIARAALISNVGVIYYFRGQFDTVIELWTYAAELEAEIGYDKGTIGTYNNMAQIRLTQGNTFEAIELLEKSKELADKHDDYVHIAKATGNIAHCYFLVGNLRKAIELYEECNRFIYEHNLEKENEELVAYNYGGLYAVYLKSDELDKALEYLLKERKIYERHDLKRKYIETINNEAQIHNLTKDYKKAIELFRKSAEEFNSIEYPRGYAVSMSNMASCYNALGDYQRALEINRKSLKVNTKLNYFSGLQSCYHTFGGSFLGLNQLDSAEFYTQKAYDMSIQLQQLEYQKSISETLFKIFDRQNNYKKALEFHKIFKQLSDSLFNDDIRNKVLKSEYEFEFQAKEIQNQQEQEKKEAIAAEQNLRQQIIILGVVIVLIIVFISAVLIYKRLKITRKQNQIINDQKQLVEIKNQEILSSINYAKRIQQAILPSQSIIDKHLPNSFVLYLPKDIVSGDFYWMQPVADKILFAAVDCTGHGVPGAFMSIVGNNGLDKAIKENKLSQPSKILDSLNQHVIDSLQKESDQNIKDGMDLVLCSLDPKNLILEYSGAYNPIYIIRNNELQETKADKQAIGLATEPYTNHQFQLLKGDVIYIFTDGYADQFGGPKGKKFTYRRYRELFLEIHKESTNKQKELLLERFEEWRGNEEQVDDVCVIGVQL